MQKSKRYQNKITNQRFDTEYIKNKINDLLSFQSDALHWNLKQVEEEVGNIAKIALSSYKQISERLGVKMHSMKHAEERINKIIKGKEAFMNLSRKLSKQRN